jgi:hypothetical protein
LIAIKLLRVAADHNYYLCCVDRLEVTVHYRSITKLNGVVRSGSQFERNAAARKLVRCYNHRKGFWVIAFLGERQRMTAGNHLRRYRGDPRLLAINA